MSTTGLLLVAGSNSHGTERALTYDPSGLELVDTRSWTVQTLDPRADSFAIADGLLLATGLHVLTDTDPTGMGLAAYRSDGKRRFSLLPGRAVWLDTRPTTRDASIGIYGRKRWALVDLRHGRISGTYHALPIPLLGAGSTPG